MSAREEAIFLGAPIALVVLALSAMCCIVLLRWKIRDRWRQTGNATHSSQQQHQHGKRYRMAILGDERLVGLRLQFSQYSRNKSFQYTL